jgi:glucose/arabinose dehydrogenase
MKWALSIVGVVLVVAAAVWWYGQVIAEPAGPPQYIANNVENDEGAPRETPPRTEVIAENLTIPWEVLFLPDGELLVTERPGTLLLLKQGVEIPVPGVEHVGEGGLLGAELHPDFAENQFLYLYQTTATPEGLRNRVNRYELSGEELRLESTIVADLPGARYHDGGRIAFGPDGTLYVTVGDAGDESAAQNSDNLAGSILRYTPEGTIPADNPFGNAVYSYGHRNPQGLAWDAAGTLWSSEHGRSGVRSGFDELKKPHEL